MGFGIPYALVGARLNVNIFRYSALFASIGSTNYGVSHMGGMVLYPVPVDHKFVPSLIMCGGAVAGDSVSDKYLSGFAGGLGFKLNLSSAYIDFGVTFSFDDEMEPIKYEGTLSSAFPFFGFGVRF